MRPPTDVGQESQAHLISPVQILEEKNQWSRRRDDREQSFYRLEQAEMVFCAPSGTNGLAHLGKQPSQLGSPARPQRRERICVLEGSALTDRRDPRPKGQKLLALEGPPEKDGAAALARLDRKLREQSTLTDPGVSQHDCDVSPSLRRTLQEIAKSPELGVSPEQRQLLRRQAQSFGSDREPGRLIGGRRSGRVSVRSESALLQQFLIEVLGL